MSLPMACHAPNEHGTRLTRSLARGARAPRLNIGTWHLTRAASTLAFPQTRDLQHVDSSGVSGTEVGQASTGRRHGRIWAP